MVEDDTDFGDQLVDLFQFHGHDVHLARDGASAIDLFRIHRHQVVVCDLMLPIQNGVKVVEEIRTLPGGEGATVFLVSAVYRDPGLFATELARVRVDRFLAKPFNLLQLGQDVDRLLRTKAGGREEPKTPALREEELQVEPKEARYLRIRRDYSLRLSLDPYGFLGVSPEASQAEVDARYRNLGALYRSFEGAPPEVVEEARALLRKLVECYETLADPPTRQVYDRGRWEAVAAVLSDEAFMTAVKAFPEALREGVGEAQELLNRDRREEAQLRLEGLRQRYAASGHLLMAIGWFQHLRGQEGTGGEEPTHLWRLALAYDPRLDFPHRCLAVAHARGGRYPESIHHLQALLRLCPEDETVRRALLQLRAEIPE